MHRARILRVGDDPFRGEGWSILDLGRPTCRYGSRRGFSFAEEPQRQETRIRGASAARAGGVVTRLPVLEVDRQAEGMGRFMRENLSARTRPE